MRSGQAAGVHRIRGRSGYGPYVSGTEPQGQDPDGHEANRVPADEQFLPGAVGRGLLEARLQYSRRGV